MITMDQYAAASKLRGVSPAAKAAFSLGSLLICISTSSNLLSVVIFCGMTGCCMFGSGLRGRSYLRLCAIPLGFVAVGALTVGVHLSASAEGLLALPLFGRYLVLTQAGAAQAVNLFLKSMAGVSCLYFLYVSTMVGELLGLLSRMHCPKLFTELAMMIYRFIFVLLDMSEKIVISQKARLGTDGFAVSLRSAGILGSSVFIKAFKRSMDILNAMESRGYTGDFDYTAELPCSTAKERLLTAGVLLVLLLTAVVCHWMGV